MVTFEGNFDSKNGDSGSRYVVYGLPGGSFSRSASIIQLTERQNIFSVCDQSAMVFFNCGDGLAYLSERALFYLEAEKSIDQWRELLSHFFV